MKKLQNNFTTPEQSKRLLELGVPADSADCYYDWYGMEMEPHPYKFVAVFNGDDTFTILKDRFKRELLPCWSVGRLIEVYLTCALEYHPYDDFYTETPSLHLMAFDKDRLIEEVIEIMSEDKMDFSKLENKL